MDKQLKEIKNYVYDKLEMCDETNNIDELHQLCCNEDYFIIGTHQAKQFCNDEVFNIINIIKDYEYNYFGEVSTDLSSPEKVVNMFCYVVGDSILNEAINYLDKNIAPHGKDYYLWDEKLYPDFKKHLIDIIDNMIVTFCYRSDGVSCTIPDSYKIKVVAT
jgi:hypothetical protein